MSWHEWKVLMGNQRGAPLSSVGTTTTNQATTAQTPYHTSAVRSEDRRHVYRKRIWFWWYGKDTTLVPLFPDDGRVPLCDFSHGLGANVEHEEEVQKTLAKAGCGQLRISWGLGSSSAPMSEGLTTEMYLTSVQNFWKTLSVSQAGWNMSIRRKFIWWK